MSGYDAGQEETSLGGCELVLEGNAALGELESAFEQDYHATFVEKPVQATYASGGQGMENAF